MTLTVGEEYELLLRQAQQYLNLPDLTQLRRAYKRDPKGRFSSGGGGAGGVRTALQDAGTTAEVGAAAAAEAKRITGRDIPFDYQDIDPQLAREYSEGVLQGLERFPEAPLGAVRATDFPPERGEDQYTWAHTVTPEKTGGQYEIEFNRGNDAADQADEVLAMKQARGVYAFGDVTGLALHEFGHVMHESRGTSYRASRLGRDYARQQTARPPAPAPSRRWPFGRRPTSDSTTHPDDEREDQRIFLLREVSFYSQHNSHEFAAEAFADVMIHGSGASPLSHQVMDLLESASD